MPATRLKEEDIRTQIERMSREPFREMLILMLSASPTVAQLKKFSGKAPDRYAQSVTQFAKLAGYSEKLEVDHKFVSLESSSDMELLDRIESIERQLAAVDITPESRNQVMNRVINDALAPKMVIVESPKQVINNQVMNVAAEVAHSDNAEVMKCAEVANHLPAIRSPQADSNQTPVESIIPEDKSST